MIIDTTTVLNDVDGEPMKDAKGELTLRRVIQAAMVSTFPEDAKMEGDEKVRLWGLAMAANADTVEWTPEQVATVRRRIGKGYGPAVVGPAYALLDPAPPKSGE